jgi:hypothetical protein
VWSTIKKLPSDKAPDPDGLTYQFYKFCWPVIKKDIMRAISAIWSRKMMGSLLLTLPISHLSLRKMVLNSQQILGQ